MPNDLTPQEKEDRELDYKKFTGNITLSIKELEDSIRLLVKSIEYIDKSLQVGSTSQSNRYARVSDRLGIKASRAILGRLLNGSVICLRKLKKSESRYSDLERIVLDPNLYR